MNLEITGYKDKHEYISDKGVSSVVYLMDCLEGLKQIPEKYFELAIVDPPYGIGDIRQRKSRNIHNAFIWNNTVPTQEYFNLLQGASKHQIVWGINYYASMLPNHTGRIIHDKTGGGYKGQLHELSDADIASHSFGVNIKIFHYVWQGNAQGKTINWKNNGEDSRIHPTQKPIALYEWLITKYYTGGGILDTHLGSGSSRIACFKANIPFMGFELDPGYFNASVKRFNVFTEQGNLF